MQNYFIPSFVGLIHKLDMAGVSHTQFRINVPGVLIEEGDLQKLTALGAEVVTEKYSGLEGVKILELSFSGQPVVADQKFSAIVASWDGRSKEKFVEVAEKFAASIGKNVFLNVPHGNTADPKKDGDFHIFVWSGPTGSVRDEDRRAPGSIWGIEVSCRDAGFRASGQGSTIYDGDYYEVAEIVGNNLFIHHDICHLGSQEELHLFEEILDRVVSELACSSEEKAERENARLEEQKKRNREAYISECNARFEKNLRGTREAIKKGEADIERLTRELTKRIRETRGAERKLGQLESCRPDELEKYGLEYDRLLELPKVVRVEVADGVVKVFTDTLYCVDPRTDVRHEIGAFRIEIYTSGANNGVRWFNLTRKIDACWTPSMAPHVNGRGEACFGNTAETFAELIAEYEFAATTMVAINFIESVNVDDSAGAQINKWPVAK